MSARELEGKVALVTGGSRGIGRAIAEALADGGAKVAVVARDGERAKAAAAALPGSGHAGFACDVSDPKQVNATLEAVEASVGPVDILVNNAGITRDNLLMRMKDEEFDEVIAANLKGAFNFTRAVTRGMMKRRDGSILNITSVVGLIGNAGQANYAASKAGLVGMTKSVARELASRNVRCNAIAPGFITTDMTGELNEKQVEELKGRIPLGDLGTPADVASAARFLVGPDARYITGQVLAVDGGMVM
ncbi:MAG: 3-oxoacyl-[acyl-carrier-protein] reductase [Gemmatimonadetes bacterium]|nr:3-oxoacyl-[acyl-carrier-protein] reductase [Gemmatimonadota bacterium]